MIIPHHIPDEQRPVDLAIPYKDEKRIIRLFLAGRFGELTTAQIELCWEIYNEAEASKYEQGNNS